jgi:DNA polymerase-3 subunit gamma/tau
MLSFRPEGSAQGMGSGENDAAAPAKSNLPNTAALKAEPTRAATRVPVPSPVAAPTRAAAPTRGDAGAQLSPQRSMRAQPSRAAPSEDLPPWLDAPPPEDEASVARPRAEAGMSKPSSPAMAVEPAGRAAAPAPQASATAIDFKPSALGERWCETVKQLSLVAMAREVALQAECLGIESDGEQQVWRFRVERESLRAPALRDKLQAALTAHIGAPLRVELEPGVAQDSPALRELAESRRRQQLADEIIHSDPLVQQVLQQFKTARIVPGSIKPI